MDQFVPGFFDITNYFHIFQRLHGWRESNSRPMVLETIALPIELHPYQKYLIKKNPGHFTIPDPIGILRVYNFIGLVIIPGSR
jgi:hypothetical protein